MKHTIDNVRQEIGIEKLQTFVIIETERGNENVRFVWNVNVKLVWNVIANETRDVRKN